MRRKPHVEDYNRKINIVFYCFMDEVFDKYKPYFPRNYYDITKGTSLENLHMTTYNEFPDLILFPSNFQILSPKIEKLVMYTERLKSKIEYKEVSTKIRKKAYENYLQKIKDQVAISMKNNENKLDETVKEIVNLLDIKGPYFRDHAVRVAKYSLLVGKELKLSKQQMQNLKHAALLHDIGLLGLPSSLIFKVGDFSSYEKAMYKLHTLIGEYLLSFPLFKEIKKIIRLHHEREDGKGFLKKKDDEVPLLSKIISICDTFDLMTTSNLLCPRMNYQEALTKLSVYGEKQNGNRKRRFNQNVAFAFLEVMKKNQDCFTDMNAIMKNM